MKTLLIAAALGALAGSPVAAEPAATAGSARPVKVSMSDPDLFKSVDSKTYEDEGVLATNRPLGQSADGKFSSGVYSAPSYDVEVDAMPYDEFIFIIDGVMNLISKDGTVLAVGKGEAAFVPKGWGGKWQSPGFKKFYVSYGAE